MSIPSKEWLNYSTFAGANPRQNMAISQTQPVNWSMAYKWHKTVKKPKLSIARVYNMAHVNEVK